MATALQSNNASAADLKTGSDGPSSTSAKSARVRAAELRRELAACVSAADVRAVAAELIRLALDRQGATRDQLAAVRLLLEYSVGKPAGDQGDQASGSPRFVFQFGGPVMVAADAQRPVPPPPPASLIAGIVDGEATPTT